MFNLGILGCSEIAYRRFMPAVSQVRNIKVKAIAEEYDRSKLEPFCKEYGLESEMNFESLINRDDIDIVYIPQPPALHYKWAKYALEHKKHVLVEKPSTTEYRFTKELVDLAIANGLAFHENYMFQYHSQIGEIQSMIANGMIGGIRLYKTAFGFPLRAKNDFRYSRTLGGGALLDAGGYTIKLASILLGDTVKVDSSHIMNLEGYEVDMYGNASLSNDEGTVCQIGFGMDCNYQCSLEVWGSKGYLYTNRIFTSPPEYEPSVEFRNEEGTQYFKFKPDSHFRKSIEIFIEEISDKKKREKMYKEILLQAKLVESIRSH